MKRLYIFLILIGLLLIIIPHNNYLLLTGVVLFTIGLLSIRLSNNNYEKTAKNRVEELNYNLKKNGVPIPVDLNLCKIVFSTSYKSTPSSSIKSAQALNYLLDISNAETTSKIVSCYLEYRDKKLKKNFKSSYISMDIKNLEIKLYLKKQTVIYYSEKKNEYFFDIDFLK